MHVNGKEREEDKIVISKLFCPRINGRGGHLHRSAFYPANLLKPSAPEPHYCTRGGPLDGNVVLLPKTIRYVLSCLS